MKCSSLETIRDWLLLHPFMRVSGGSSDGFFFIQIYGNRFHRARWFRATVIPVYRMLRAIHKASWWVKWRIVPKHRYHMIDTRLTPAYYDFDERMLHGCMSLLCDYVERCHGSADALQQFSAAIRAKPDPNAPEGLQEGQADRQDETVTIYRWWKQERHADLERREALLMKTYGAKGTSRNEALFQEFRAVEDKIFEDEQRMLHRLVDIRPGLWD